jgi:uncharacterized protein (DUF1330 family)
VIEIHDREEYGENEKGFLEILSRYYGELLVVEETPTVLEGEWLRTRTVVIQCADENEACAGTNLSSTKHWCSIGTGHQIPNSS